MEGRNYHSFAIHTSISTASLPAESQWLGKPHILKLWKDKVKNMTLRLTLSGQQHDKNNQDGDNHMPNNESIFHLTGVELENWV